MRLVNLMEVFHGLTSMESFTNLEGFYPEFSSRKETRTVEDAWSMAFLSGISSDVEHFEDHFENSFDDRNPPSPIEKPIEQPAYSPPMMESPDSFGEQWLSELLPLGGVYSPPLSAPHEYQPMPTAFPSLQTQQGAYTGAVVQDTPGSYPPSPQSNSSLDGSDISDLLEIVEDLTAEPSGMYSFTCSPPPQAVPELPCTMSSTLQGMLSSPPASGPAYKIDIMSYYPPEHPTEPVTPKAKDLNSLSDVEKLLMEPLPIAPTQRSRKRQCSKFASKPIEKKLKKKEQNKNAALRYRQKKRDEKNVLTVKQEELEQENGQLKSQVDSLEREIGYLKDLLNEVQRRRMSAAV